MITHTTYLLKMKPEKPWSMSGSVGRALDWGLKGG